MPAMRSVNDLVSPYSPGDTLNRSLQTAIISNFNNSLRQKEMDNNNDFRQQQLDISRNQAEDTAMNQASQLQMNERQLEANIQKNEANNIREDKRLGADITHMTNVDATNKSMQESANRLNDARTKGENQAIKTAEFEYQNKVLAYERSRLIDEAELFQGKVNANGGFDKYMESPEGRAAFNNVLKPFENSAASDAYINQLGKEGKAVVLHNAENDELQLGARGEDGSITPTDGNTISKADLWASIKSNVVDPMQVARAIREGGESEAYIEANVGTAFNVLRGKSARDMAKAKETADRGQATQLYAEEKNVGGDSPGGVAVRKRLAEATQKRTATQSGNLTKRLEAQKSSEERLDTKLTRAVSSLAARTGSAGVGGGKGEYQVFAADTAEEISSNKFNYVRLVLSKRAPVISRALKLPKNIDEWGDLQMQQAAELIIETQRYKTRQQKKRSTGLGLIGGGEDEEYDLTQADAIPTPSIRDINETLEGMRYEGQ